MTVEKKNRIRFLRKQNKVKAKDLAAAVEMTYNNLYWIEKNVSRLTAVSISKFCEFFHCRPDYLYEDYKEENK